MINPTKKAAGGLVLGIDGGGTKTIAAVANTKGVVMGVGQGGPSNIDDIGARVVGQNIAAAIQQAREMANLGQDQVFESAFFGMAGVVTKKDRSAISRIALSLNCVEPGHIGVDHDCRIALAGGLCGRPGIVLITGTGSSCFGINRNAEGWLTGGWGHLLADEGSGYWLGVHAMRTMAAVGDGRIAHSMLFDLVSTYLKLSEPREVMHRLYVEGLSRLEIGAMAPLVIEAAHQGDPAAQRLLERAAADLAEIVHATTRRLKLDAGACEIVQIGGLLNAGDVYLQPLRSSILKRVPGAKFVLPELPPVLGACLLAIQELGVELDESIYRALEKSTLVLK